ncbi:hypothetical protein HMSSN139_45500 [Paenibacillus sp. HMSSN-139]|nr:hypothetical protein HMSSN139_45500 [Paenibacillus sp. HMSSN-139]
MISINPEHQTERDNYKLLIGSIIPRPVALVTTLSREGVLNAAPFSYFNIVTADPPMVSVAVQRKDGAPKDTARNAAAAGAFVVHIADEAYIRELNLTAARSPRRRAKWRRRASRRSSVKRWRSPGSPKPRFAWSVCWNARSL